MQNELPEILIIGAGPAGYVLAEKLAAKGHQVLCVDNSPLAGGTCLNIGCIPSKALLHASHLYSQASQLGRYGIQANDITFSVAEMMEYKLTIVEKLGRDVEGLLRRRGVKYIKGTASLVDDKTIQVLTESDKFEISTEKSKIVIATGSRPIELPFAPFDEKTILSSTGALSLQTIPEHLVVIGGGVIALELGSVWKKLGSKVTIIELCAQILPSMDRDIAIHLQKILEKEGMKFLLETVVNRVEKTEAGIKVYYNSDAGTLEASHLLVAVGRKPTRFGEAAGLQLDELGYVVVDKNYKTNLPGIFAIGDATKGPMLAHRASDDAVALADFLSTGSLYAPNYSLIPNVVYTHPEIATVGRSEIELKAEGISYSVRKSLMKANARANISFDEGFVKVLVSADDEILGIAIISPSAGEMIGEAVVAMNFRAAAEDIQLMSHPHPTLIESIKSAMEST